MSKTRNLGRHEFAVTIAASAAMLPIAALPLSASPAAISKQSIPASGELIPVLGMGTWITFNVGPSERLRKACAHVLQSFFDHGGAMVGSSPMYGSSEEVIGYCLKQVSGPDRILSATKVWMPVDNHGAEQMETSERLSGETPFDLLQVHNLLNWETHLETFKSSKAKKRLSYIGITTSHGKRHDDFADLMRTQPLDFAQFTYNILDRGAEDRLLPLAADQGITIIVNRPFRRSNGFEHLAGHSVPDWAAEFGADTLAQFFLKFVLSHPSVTCAIPATSKVDHMVENMAAVRCWTRRCASA